MGAPPPLLLSGPLFGGGRGGSGEHIKEASCCRVGHTAPWWPGGEIAAAVAVNESCVQTHFAFVGGAPQCPPITPPLWGGGVGGVEESEGGSGDLFSAF